MKGDRLYLFRCGCMAYELTTKHERNWICPVHREKIKEIHGFCEQCGLHIIIPPNAHTKKLCDYETTLLSITTGKLLRSAGCSGVRQRLNSFKNYRKRNPKVLRKSRAKKTQEENEPKDDLDISILTLKRIFKKYQWPIIKTPTLDKLGERALKN